MSMGTKDRSTPPEFIDKRIAVMPCTWCGGATFVWGRAGQTGTNSEMKIFMPGKYWVWKAPNVHARVCVVCGAVSQFADIEGKA